jgi:acetyl-CoA C-acetyltransferase
MTTSVLVAGVRTPIGKFSGSLADLSAVELGGIAIRGAVERAGIAADDVDYVIMGQVLQAGCGQIPARQAAVAGGIGMEVPAITINKVCLSGIDAVTLADQLIRAGEYQVVVAGGMESMTQAPHLLPKSRAGYKFGDVTVLDSLAHDGLTDVFTEGSMGVLTEGVNIDQSVPVTRAEQDEFAVGSHRKAAAAVAAGLMDSEIVPVVVKSRRGDLTVTTDEGIRADVTIEALAKLRPSFRPDGSITAGSSSPISDGAVAVVVMDKAVAEARGLRWIAEIGPSATVAGPDSTLQLQPAAAIRAVCKRAGVEPTDLDLVEINEAFAAVGITSARDLGIDEGRVNVNGGAIAVGHPIGASGARIVLHLALELGRRGGGTGVAALCGGGGQGQALLITAPSAA